MIFDSINVWYDNAAAAAVPCQKIIEMTNDDIFILTSN